MKNDGKSKNNLHQGHRPRMRVKMLNGGAKIMEEHEILEFLLFYSLPRKNTNEIAHILINTFGSIRGVMDATPEELAEIRGIDKHSIVFIKALGEMMKRRKKAEKKYEFNGDYKELESIVRKVSAETNGKGIYAMVFGENKEFLFACAVTRDMKGLFDNLIHRILPDKVHGVAFFEYVKSQNAFPSSIALETVKGLESALALNNVVLYEYFLIGESNIVGIKGKERFCREVFSNSNSAHE
jgi:DNA repair protein RadC